MISDTTPEKRTTTYSKLLQISNKIPYNALPNGCAHIEKVRTTAITLPIKFCGVSVCIKDSICIEKIVENTIIIKQHIVITI